MRNVGLIGLLLVTMTAAFSTGFTRRSATSQQVGNARLNIKDLADQGLIIIGSSDPSYDAMVQAFLKGKSNSIVDSLGPFSVFVKNTSTRTVVACVLNWEMLQSNGRIRKIKAEYTNLPALMGNDVSEIKEGLKITPNSAWLFSPSQLQVDQDEGGARAVSNDNPSSTRDLDRARSQLASDLSITVTLDGAFFDDGTFIGPDSTGFFARVEAIRNAKRDLFREIDNAIKKSKTRSDVFQNLEDLASRPNRKLSDASTPADYYNSFKQDAAAELLRIRNHEGDDKALEEVHKKLGKPWPELRKS